MIQVKNQTCFWKILKRLAERKRDKNTRLSNSIHAQRSHYLLLNALQVGEQASLSH
jgi:hypothetical protein